MARTSRFRSIFLRVLAIGFVAGGAALVLSTVLSFLLVTDDKEASLTEAALAETTRMSDQLDRRIERARAELAAAALAAEAGRPLEARDLVGADVRALRVERGAEVLLEAAEDRDARAQLAAVDDSVIDVTLLSGDEILVRRDLDGLRSLAILDRAQVLGAPPVGWEVGVRESSPDAVATRARRLRVESEERVEVTAPGDFGLTLVVSAPLAPARQVARGVAWQVLQWSWVLILPILLISVLLARRVTAPIRALADAVEGSGDDVELPALGADEIGELGAAIERLSARLRNKADALRRAERFARHAGEMSTPEELFAALERALRTTVEPARWTVLSAEDIASGAAASRVEVRMSALERALNEAGPASFQLPADDPMRATMELPGIREVDDRTLIPLRSERASFGVVVGTGVPDDASKRMAQLLCRVAAAALTNQDLAREALAGEKLSALGRLAASVAHEINNPLSTVLANLHALEGELDGEPLDVARDARRGADNVAAIVRDLSLLARGGRKVSFFDADLVDVVDGVVQKVAAKRDGIRFEIEAPKSLTVGCSAQRVEQALLNIIGNAADAIVNRPQPSVWIRVAARGERVVVRVRDNGPGISPAVRRRLFEPFVTGKGDRGTGLGLYLARTMARTHGGDVELVRTSADGTLFELWLPQRAGAAATTPESGPAARARPRLLLVDDDPRVLRATARWLRRRADVVTTTDPTEALTLIDAQRPDLVLCDLQMTPIDGRALAAEIAKRWPSLASRVVFVSGAATPGPDAFQKPLRSQDVERILRRASSSEPPAAVAEETG